MRTPLEAYFQGATAKVFSLVASVPYSPIDLDLNLLARGEWDALHDRFRIWYLPRGQAQNDKPVCYVMVRKFDHAQGVLTCAHFVMNLGAGSLEGEPEPNFTVGILSNDEIRARSILGAMLGIPPIFHRRSEIRLIERRWRTDPETVARFAANVYSVSTAGVGPGGEVHQLKIRLPPDIMAQIGTGLDMWWDAKDRIGRQEEPNENPPGDDDEYGTSG